MSWQDRFQEGSFRGVPFYITSAPTQVGRRAQMHEYPGRDTPWSEDLGRKGRQWQLEVFVVGDDYDQARDALIAALEAPGAGTLVHPYLGTVQALPGIASVTDSTDHGGMATFSIPFSEAGSDVEPSPTPDTGAASGAAAGALQAASIDSVTAGLNVSGVEGFVATAASAVLGTAAAAIGAALDAVKPDPTAAFPARQQIAALSAPGLLSDPAGLVAGVYAAVSSVNTLATYSDDALGAVTGLLGFGAGLPPVAPTTVSRTAQAANQATLVTLVQCAAAAAAAQCVSTTDFSSYDEAAGIRDSLADQLDDLATTIAGTFDDELSGAVDALRLAVVADVTARGASLATLYDYTPVTTEPAVVIAQRLYGDASWADDIIARNLIPRPGFTPGGVALEVLGVVA